MHVTAIEGLTTEGKLHPMQEVFRAEEQGPKRARDPRVIRGQSLPLHRLSQHRHGDQSRRCRYARRCVMAAAGIGVEEDFRFLTGQEPIPTTLARQDGNREADPSLIQNARAQDGSPNKERYHCSERSEGGNAGIPERPQR